MSTTINNSECKLSPVDKSDSEKKLSHLVRNWSKTSERKEVEAYVGRKSTSVPSSLLGADGKYGNPYVVGLHGTRDEVIPYNQAARLAKENPGVLLVTIEGGRHNNLNDSPLFQQQLNSILQLP